MWPFDLRKCLVVLHAFAFIQCSEKWMLRDDSALVGNCDTIDSGRMHGRRGIGI